MSIGQRMFLAVFSGTVLFFTAFVLGVCAGFSSMRSQAINVGCGEWAINSKTGEKSFQFISPERKE